MQIQNNQNKKSNPFGIIIFLIYFSFIINRILGIIVTIIVVHVVQSENILDVKLEEIVLNHESHHI